MIRTWLAVALLAVSWLLGLGYFQQPQWVAWAIVTTGGSLLLVGSPVRLPAGREAAVALAMLVPVVWFMGRPDRAAPLAMAAGLALVLVGIPHRWPLPIARGAIAAGIVLLVQWIAVAIYTAGTARSHDLGWPMPQAIAGVASLLGIDASTDGSMVAFQSLRQVHRLAVTWELLFDPATLAFFVGGLALLGLTASGLPSAGQSWTTWLRGARRLALVVALWLPVRTGLLVALFLHRAVRADAGERLNLMNQFFSPWVYLAMLLPPALLAWRFVRLPPTVVGQAASLPVVGQAASLPHHPSGTSWQLALRPAAVLGLLLAAVAIVTFAWRWNPVGSRLEGRVMVVERHSDWEPTDRPYDTESYGEDASYSYTAIYNYCSQFYTMSRLGGKERIDAERLSQCDVLVVKTVTARYEPEEVDAIRRFVQQGGGLLLISEHTDTKIQTPYANDLASQFGFKFREDVLFRIGDDELAYPYKQAYQPPHCPHPMVQHVPPMVFAVSCSVDPGSSRGEAAILETGLWSLTPDYHATNFFPEPEMRSDARFGAFIQLWTAIHGRGRVAAWTDSTIFSNFTTFEPGKPELMLGMLEWLNRRSLLDRWGVRMLAGTLALAAAIGLAAIGWNLVRKTGISWLPGLAAGLLGWTAATAGVAALHRYAMPPPEAVRPLPRIVLDRTVSTVPLSWDGYTEPDGSGYGLLEQWIPRLGYYTVRQSGPAAFSGDVLVVICPIQSVPEDYRQRLQEYVASGGKLLVIDSIANSGTTANSLLRPFGMAMRHATSRQGALALSDGWPAIPVQGACEVAGGQPFLWVDSLPVGSVKDFGQGAVMAIGCGHELNDGSFGQHWMREPTAEELKRFNLLFALVRGLTEGKPVAQPPVRAKK